MDTARIYHDSEDNECTIWQMIKHEPEWAANVIQGYEDRVKKLESQIQAMQKVMEAVDRFYKDSIDEDCKNPNCPDCNLKRVYEEYLIVVDI
jgi:hypothetical protein